jgi:hypothetical protein
MTPEPYPPPDHADLVEERFQSFKRKDLADRTLRSKLRAFSDPSPGELSAGLSRSETYKFLHGVIRTARSSSPETP